MTCCALSHFLSPNVYAYVCKRFLSKSKKLWRWRRVKGPVKGAERAADEDNEVGAGLLLMEGVQKVG